MTKLPIDIISAHPPNFRWTAQVDGQVIDMDGSLSASAEVPVIMLIYLARKLEAEVASLKKENAELRGKIMVGNGAARLVNAPAAKK